MCALQASDPSQAGPYTLVDRLGSGGMGQVYLGVSAAAERVAVKVVRPDVLPDETARQRFAGEVDSLRMVFGSRVARFEGADLEHDPPWLAVEYVPGHTLAQHVELYGPLDADLIAILAAMLCEGLAKVHESGLLHRDLKPQNIMLGPDGPKILDFGLAKLTHSRTQLTAPGGLIGTIAYMPPEQARSEADLTTATDVYALGATLAHAATGGLLYPLEAPAALLYTIADPATSPDLSAVPRRIAPLIADMVAYDPAARPDLTTVGEAMLAIATTPAATLRGRLVSETYRSQPATDIDTPRPAQVTRPQVASSDGVNRVTETAIDEAHSDHSSTPGQEVPPSAGPPSAGPRAGDRSDSAVDVSWLVAELRAGYARDAPF